jgi:RNA polymerase sigma-70 factor (ECF subfamily)
VRFQLAEINGGPGALVLDADGRVAGALALEVGGGQIQRVMSVVNPDKLAHLGTVANFGDLLRGQ